MPESPNSKRPARSWEKIVVETDSRMSEAVAAYLADLSGSGVEISTPAEDQINGKDRPVICEKITAYIPLNNPEAEAGTTDELIEFLDRLSHIFPDYPSPRFNTERVDEEDWSRLWKSYFSSFQVTPTLTIKPTWEEADDPGGTPNGQHFVIEMDPGLAFGTGHHASTQLALMLLEQIFENKKGRQLTNILDVGTGSGILAMACGLFGAENVLAIDNDPDAVATAAANVERNRLSDKVTVNGRDIALLPPGFDLIVANITHDTLAAMAPVSVKLLAPGGSLVLSGILKDNQEDSIRKIYTGQGLNFIKSVTRDEWAALLFQKIQIRNKP